MKGICKRLLTLGAALCLAVLFTVPALAVPEQGYYTFLSDEAGLLEEWEMDELEAKAASITETYGFAPYIIVIESLGGVDVTDKALSFWDEYSLGVENADGQREGSLLLMSMEDRDFDYEVWDYTNAVFDEYRFDSVQQAFLAEFRDDNWYEGFYEYLNATEYYLSGAADDVEEGEDWDYYGDYEADYGGEYEEGPSLLTILLFLLVIPCAVAGIICGILAVMMTSVHHATSAGSYVTGGGVDMRVQQDQFTHRTETRHKIERNDDHSSSSSGGGGGGGGGHFSSSGKF